MEFMTVDHWDKGLWAKASPIYQQAFGERGAKSPAIIEKMFAKELCQLHLALEGNEAVAMALTGLVGNAALLIDYLAVRNDRCNQGIGLAMMDYITRWAVEHARVESMIIEVESPQTNEDLDRIRFWRKCGFRLTDYVHHYIWVPEPYQAMYRKLTRSSQVPEDGKKLFAYITEFHRASYRDR